VKFVSLSLNNEYLLLNSIIHAYDFSLPVENAAFLARFVVVCINNS
jgi:hypothetical protein